MKCNIIVCSRVAIKVCIPTSNGEVFTLLHIVISIICQIVTLYLAILTFARHNPRLILICISWSANNADHSFKCFFFSNYSFVKNSVQAYNSFLNWIFLLMSTFLSMYFKYQTSVTSGVGEHIFPSCRPQFVLLIVDFVLQNFLNIMMSNLLIMILSTCALVFSSGCCLLCQRVLSLSLHSLLLAQDI